MTNTGYSIANISEVLGSSLGLIAPDRRIRDLLIDSRRLNHPEQTLFFALVGERHDGHAFVYDLYKKGVRNFVISQLPKGFEKMKSANFIKVPNTLDALQALAAFHRDNFQLPVVGITGSNGKTIVKEWLYQLLNQDYNIVRSPKSYNSQVGVPLSVWMLQQANDMALIEAGISQPREMKRLWPMIKPSTGLFTTIGDAHSENFNNRDQQIDEKLQLFRGVDTLLYNRDLPQVEARILASPFLKTVKRVCWTRQAGSSEADLVVTSVTPEGNGTTIVGQYQGETISITIPFIDNASIENATLCWLALLHNGYNNKVIAQRMQRLSPVGLRLEIKRGINDCTVINDSYNSDVGSLQIALDLLKQQAQHDKKTLILSDIQESGGEAEALYQRVADLVNAQPLTRFIGIGEQLSAHKHLFLVKDQRFFNTTKGFLGTFSNQNFNREAILVKGARTYRFEELAELLQQQSHETVLEINLNALVHNLNFFKSRLRPSTRVMAMVKAFSYGSGSHEIANVLQFHRVDYLGVAYADEGVELRKAGVNLPIMVMSPEEQSFNDLFLYNLEPEVYSMAMLERLGYALKHSHLGEKLPFSIHVMLDTGMHRLGFDPEDLEPLAEYLANDRYLKVASIFSHLAASDDPQHDDFTQEQIDRFEKGSHYLMRELGYPVMRHLANSAGAARFPEAQFDMVRLGIGLYGLGANRYEDANLEPVGALKTSIAQIKTVKKGETVGYGRVGVANSDLQIATVSIGYADGLNRLLGNGVGHMIVRGKKAPIIGQVCMDMTMLDVTGMSVQEGDEVVVFGKELPIRSLASKLGTIPYEVLTSISRRVKRVYFQE